MWGKIMIPMYRLWLYGLYGPQCPMSPERLLNLITHSLDCNFQQHSVSHAHNKQYHMAFSDYFFDLLPIDGAYWQYQLSRGQEMTGNYNVPLNLHFKQRYSCTVSWFNIRMAQVFTQCHINGLMQERRNSIANALEFCLSCTNSSISVDDLQVQWQLETFQVPQDMD